MKQKIRLSELVNPTAKQRVFLDTVKSHKFTLYGGAAGGGKSRIIRWWLVLFLINVYQTYKLTGVQVGLFCEDYPSLKDRQVSKIETEFPRWLGTLKTTKAEGLRFKLSADLGGGMILLRNLDDPAKYDSVEFAAIGVDELTKNPVAVFNELRKRLRWPGLPEDFLFPFAGGSNPGGIGHGWVKKVFIEKQMPPELKGKENLFAYVPAKAQDNPHLPSAYYEDLKTLPEAMRKAYAEGDWDTFQGQYFTIFDKSVNTIRPERIGIESWWPRWISMDWGFEHDFCVHWHTRAPNGQVFTYREYVDNHLSEPTIASEVVQRSKGEDIAAFYGPWDIFGPSVKRAGQNTIAEEMNEVLVKGGLPAITKAADDRVGGWRLMYSMLESGQWMIAESCPKLIEILPVLVRHDVKVEDVAKVDGDDPADCARYGLKSHLEPGEMPAEKRWERQVAAVKTKDPEVDLNVLIHLRQKFEKLERDRTKPQTWR